MSVSEVQALCGDPQAGVSPLLCLSQTPNVQFLQPVKVQIPLPSGVTGTVCYISFTFLYNWICQQTLTCLVLMQAIQLICPVYICFMETPLPKPGLTSHHKCLFMSPICMPFSTLLTFPGKFPYYSIFTSCTVCVVYMRQSLLSFILSDTVCCSKTSLSLSIPVLIKFSVGLLLFLWRLCMLDLVSIYQNLIVDLNVYCIFIQDA